MKVSEFSRNILAMSEGEPEKNRLSHPVGPAFEHYKHCLGFARDNLGNPAEITAVEIEGCILEGPDGVRRCRADETPEFYGIYLRVKAEEDAHEVAMWLQDNYERINALDFGVALSRYLRVDCHFKP